MRVTKKFTVTENNFREIVRSFRQLHKALPQPMEGERVLALDTCSIKLSDTTKLSFLDKKGALNMSYEARRDLANGQIEIIYTGDERDFGYGDIGALWGCHRQTSPVVYGDIITTPL